MSRKTKAAVADQSWSVTQKSPESAAASNSGTDQILIDTHHWCVRPVKASESGHSSVDSQNLTAASLDPIIAQIRSWHRQRVFAMEQRKRSDLALGSFLRVQLGWSRALPKADADKISKQALHLLALGERVAKGKVTGIGDPLYGLWGTVIAASLQGRSHWDAIETEATKEMERLAESLPIWPQFGEPIKGFGARSLAVIVGEAGDLNLYANPAKLWKRMGLAVLDGVRQGGLRKTASADEWIAHGYNAKRRSFMFVIGDVLVKNQSVYRDIYLQRKEYERTKAAERGLTVAPAAKIPAKRKDEFMSDGHIHRRAQRYMEKRLLRDLWRAWRRATSLLQPFKTMPDASIQQTTASVQPKFPVSAERSASIEPLPNSVVPSAPIRQTTVPVPTSMNLSGKRRPNKTAKRSTRQPMKPRLHLSGA